jgi:Patatin-like phospholipase
MSSFETRDSESALMFETAFRRAQFVLLSGACVLSLAGCLPIESGGMEHVPAALVERVNVAEYRNIRFYSDDLQSLRELAEDRIRDIRRAHPGRLLAGKNVEINYLSLSGGGGEGAYGAGFLNGWSDSGTRPTFDVVTGISTGALLAPFAFLGSDYDSVMKQAYTTTSTADVADEHAVQALLGVFPSLNSNEAFERLIARYVTPEVVAAIAREDRKGRMLLIGTTNLDAERAVIWDIGAIADSGQHDARELIVHIIMASATIPGVFPPVHLRVNADGQLYDEYHVDGGVTRQVFLFPPGYDPGIVDRAIGWKPQRHAYILRNGRIAPEYKSTDITLMSVANRSIASLIKTQGIGDLYRIALVSDKNHIDYNLAFVPPEFTSLPNDMFDRTYMSSLFAFGYEQSLHGYHWHKQPPGLEAASSKSSIVHGQ